MEAQVSDWQALQFKDECERLREIVEALEVAEKSGTPHEVVQLLARECGAGEFYEARK